MREPLDLDYAAAGWLLSPWGRVRAVRGIDRLAADARTLGASVWWDCSDGARAGYCVIGRREIVLAAWLFWCSPYLIRRCLGEELAHIVVGPSEERAAGWRERRYGELVYPAFV